MRRGLRTPALLLLIGAGCQDLPPIEPRGSFSFGVLGDGPYTRRETNRFRRVLEDVRAADIRFLIHVGDILWYPCADGTLRQRRDALARLPVPVVYTPGDNEWTDCWEPIAGEYEPLERLSAIRRIFFGDTAWTPIERLGPVSQSADPRWSSFRENVRWTTGGIVFATMHVVGSDNGLERFPGRTAADDSAAAERMEAAIAWMRETFQAAAGANAPAVVLAMHADPALDDPTARRRAYAPLIAELAALAKTWQKPVLLVHGDSHEHVVDHPLRDPRTGAAVPNVTRLITFGSPDIGWIHVSVDTLGPQLFQFTPRLMERRFLLW